MTAPFGIEFGSAISALDVLEDVGANKYFVTAPRPHPQFSTYIVQASPAFGIVWIKGLSPEFENDSYGNTVRAAVDRLAGQLAERYGAGDKTDFLSFDALFEEPRDWVMAVLQGERHYFHSWKRPTQGGLPDDLDSIYAGVHASSSDTANFVVEYSSVHFEAAEAELDAILSDLL